MGLAASENCSPITTPKKNEDINLDYIQETPNESSRRRTLREEGKLYSSTGFYKMNRSSSVPENKEYLLNQYRELKHKEEEEENQDLRNELHENGTTLAQSNIQMVDTNQTKIASKSLLHDSLDRYKVSAKFGSSTFYTEDKSKTSRSITPGPGGFPVRENLPPGKLKRMIPVEVPPVKSNAFLSFSRIHTGKNPGGESEERADSVGKDRVCRGLSITRGIEKRASVPSLRTTRTGAGSFAESANMMKTSRDFKSGLNSLLSTSGPNFFKNNPGARQRMFESYQNIQNFIL